MKREEKGMKLLKIEENKGYFLSKDEEYKPLDKLTKEDLLYLANYALDEDASYDEFDEEHVKNQAHQIIYRSVFKKLKALSDRKEEFRDESERLYLKDYERYQNDISEDEQSGD